MLMYSSYEYNDQGLVRHVPGTWNSIWVFHVGTGAQVTAPSSTVFPGALSENWIESEAGGT